MFTHGRLSAKAVFEDAIYRIARQIVYAEEGGVAWSLALMSQDMEKRTWKNAVRNYIDVD